MTITTNQELALIELYQISRQIVSPENVNTREILQQIAQVAYEVLSADFLTLYTYDQKRQEFDGPLRVGLFRDFRSTWEDEISKPEKVFSSKAAESRYILREGIKSFARIPLRFGDEILGVLFVVYRTTQSFTQEQRELIELFANQATIALKTLNFVQRAHYKELSAEQKVRFY